MSERKFRVESTIRVIVTVEASDREEAYNEAEKVLGDILDGERWELDFQTVIQ